MFKKKPAEIKFKSFDPHLVNYLRPESAKKYYPNWFINTPSFCHSDTVSPNFSHIKAATIKRCPAIHDFFNEGVVIPCWSDIEFFVDGPKKSIEWRYSNDYPNLNLIQAHSGKQFPELEKKYLHAKVISPWIAEANTGLKWYMTKPSYDEQFDDQDVVFCDGIVQFKSNFSTHVNLFFPIKNTSYNVKFSAGKPFQKLIPLTENTINISTEHCSREYYDYAALQGRRISFHPGKMYNLFR